MGEVFQEYSEKNHPELPALTIIQGGGTVLREKSERKLQYDKSSLAWYKMVREDDFIVHLRSFEGGLEKSNHNGLISPAYHTFHGDEVDSRFYYPYFRSYEFIKHKLVPHVYGIRDGRSIDIDGMKTIEIPWTSYEEQKKIGDYIESLDTLITLHQRKLFLNFAKRNDWEQRKLNEVAEFNPKSELPDEFEYVDLESVVGTEMISHRTETKDSAPSRAQRLAQPGDVFFQTVRPYQKNNYLFSKLDNNYVFSTGYAQMRPNIDTAFLMSFLQTDSFVKIVLDNCTGTSYPAINSNDLSNLEISLPKSFEEQKKVGKTIISIDNLITLHQRKCDETKKLKKFMLQKMFPKKDEKKPEIRFAGFTDDWEQRKLIDYLEVSSEKNRDNRFTKDDVLSVSGEYGIVNQIEFQGRSFAGASVSNYGVVENGDVVYTKSPLKSNPYGIIKTNKGIPGIVSTLYAVYKPKEITDSKFVQIYFELDSRMNSYMHPLVNKGAKNDMKVSAENALKGMVSFPKKDEQEMISLYFSYLDNLIALHQRKCDEIKKIKKFMLQNMFPQKG